MAETNYGKIDQAEFERGIDERIRVDELEEQDWYMAREATEAAQSLGAYAIEQLVVLKEVEEGYDCYNVSFGVWDNQRGVVRNEEVIVNLEGMIVNPTSLKEYGYFIEPTDNLDDSGVTEDEKHLVKAGNR